MNDSIFKLPSAIMLALCMLLLGACNDDDKKDDPAPDPVPPTISSFSPDTGLAGDTIAINGENFSTTKTENVVEINGMAATVISASADSLTITVPEEATTGKVTVTVDELTATSTKDFTILPSLKVSGFSPTSGLAGDTVTITGENFSATASENVVEIGGTVAPISSATTTELKVTVPEEAATGSISVTAHRQTVTTGEDVFTVIHSPAITGFSPAWGAIGTDLTIYGENFSATPEENLVKIGTSTATVTAATTTQLTVTVPDGAISGSVFVTVNGQVATTGQSVFTVIYTPVISSFSPAQGAVGTSVVINGEHFSATPEENEVTIGGATASVTAASTTQLTVTVPEDATTGSITVTTKDLTGTSGETFFTIVEGPIISSFSPESGLPGDEVIITGENFSTTASENTVKFGTVAATVSASTATQLTVTVPADAVTGKISVTTNGITATSTNNYAVLRPVINSFSPQSGVPDDVVTITGENFSPVIAENIVKFGFRQATITAASATELTVIVPQDLNTGLKISVNTNGLLTYSADNFTVPPPQITSFSPESGELGDTVTITGANFSPLIEKNTVKINGSLPTILSATSTTLVVKVSKWATTGKVSVTSWYQTATSVNDFTVLDVAVTHVSPGGNHTMFLREDNTLWASGDNTYGQLGDGTTTSVAEPKLIMEDVLAVSAGGSHTLILKTDHTLWGCGNNQYGQMGIGMTDLSSIVTPMQIMTDVKKAVAGPANSLILTNSNELWVCGRNNYGQVGNGKTANAEMSLALIKSDVKTMAAGNFHTMVVTNDDKLWTCGYNAKGQLGDHTKTNSSTLIEITGGVKDVAAGIYHSMVLKGDTVWATGDNLEGQMGAGTLSGSVSLIMVGKNIQKIEAGQYHTTALGTDNSMWVTGSDDFRQVGMNGFGPTTFTEREYVVTDVFSSANATFYIKEGKLWGTGKNDSGQIGIGTTSNPASPQWIYFVR